MHRFMRHLDDLAGLDVHFDIARRADAILLPRADMDGRGLGLAAMLRKAIGRDAKQPRGAMCRDERRPTTNCPPNALVPSPDHVLPPRLDA